MESRRLQPLFARDEPPTQPVGVSRMTQIRKRQGKAIEGSHDLGEVYPGWRLCRLEEKWKVYSLDVVAGSANYGFRVKNREIDKNANIDARALKLERPAVYTSIERFLRTYVSKHDPDPDIGDVYGDIAISRKQKLTPDQLWRRGLLLLRLRDLEILAKLERHGIWEPCIEYLHQGVYKSNITAKAKAAALSFVTSDNAPRISQEALTQVEQDYYSGAYNPQACAELQGQLDMLTEPVAEEVEPLTAENIPFKNYATSVTFTAEEIERTNQDPASLFRCKEPEDFDLTDLLGPRDVSDLLSDRGIEVPSADDISDLL